MLFFRMFLGEVLKQNEGISKQTKTTESKKWLAQPGRVMKDGFRGRAVVLSH